MLRKVMLLFIFVFSAYGGANNPIEIKYPLKHTTYYQDKVTFLHSGTAALAKRLDMIKRAKKRISLEYFIFEKDKTGKLLLHELINKAKEGVQVQLLLDMSITVIDIDEVFAEILRSKNVQVRYYNRALGPITAQYRTHRKIFAIDGKEVIVGGRNIGDDYFDLDEVYNFLDRDIHISGPMAKAIEDSFDYFWNDSKIVVSERPIDEFDGNRLFRNKQSRERYELHRRRMLDKRRKEIREWLYDFSDIKGIKENVYEVGMEIFQNSKTHVCPELTFVSDAPGGKLIQRLGRNFQGKYQHLGNYLRDKFVREANGDAWILSPYFIMNEAWFETLITVMQKKDTKLHVLTNSLNSTDAFYVSAVFYHQIPDLIDAGLDTFVANASYPEYFTVPYESVKETRWGVHAKTYIINKSSAMVGTYNIDNRSDVLNAELGVFCDGNKEFVDDLKEDLNKRLTESVKLLPDNKAKDQSGNNVDIYGGASEKNVKIMKAFKLPSLFFIDIL